MHVYILESVGILSHNIYKYNFTFAKLYHFIIIIIIIIIILKTQVINEVHEK